MNIFLQGKGFRLSLTGFIGRVNTNNTFLLTEVLMRMLQKEKAEFEVNMARYPHSTCVYVRYKVLIPLCFIPG